MRSTSQCLVLLTPLVLFACGGGGSTTSDAGPGDSGGDAPSIDASSDAGGDAEGGSPDAGPLGDGGLTTVNVSLSDATFLATTIQPDGKIVSAGAADDAFIVARHLATGAPDTTFGSGGIVTTPFGGALPRFQPSQMSVMVQPDGKIVLVSYYRRLGAFNATAGIVLRYATDGTLDTTFAGTGYVVDSASWYAGRVACSSAVFRAVANRLTSLDPPDRTPSRSPCKARGRSGRPHLGRLSGAEHTPAPRARGSQATARSPVVSRRMTALR